MMVQRGAPLGGLAERCWDDRRHRCLLPDRRCCDSNHIQLLAELEMGDASGSRGGCSSGCVSAVVLLRLVSFRASHPAFEAVPGHGFGGCISRRDLPVPGDPEFYPPPGRSFRTGKLGCGCTAVLHGAFVRSIPAGKCGRSAVPKRAAYVSVYYKSCAVMGSAPDFSLRLTGCRYALCVHRRSSGCGQQLSPRTALLTRADSER